MIRRVAINGFGRIGRMVFRIINNRRKHGSRDLEVSAINDLANINTLAHLLKYDSVHGKFKEDIHVSNNGLIVDGNLIKVYSESDPSFLPWKTQDISIVLESTGHFLSKDKALKHINAGAKKVLISAPCKGLEPDATICYGINHENLISSDAIISTASCTTNCIVPIAKILNDNFGIIKAFVTTIHSYTSDQNILDSPNLDMRRARTAGLSIIPTTTGAAKAVSLILPELIGKFDGMAIRVPTPNVSLIDLVAQISQNTTVEEINSLFEVAANGLFKGIMGFSKEPLVSVDMIGTTESSIIDALSTKVLGNNFVKILSWYDNECGFGNRAVDLMYLLAEKC